MKALKMLRKILCQSNDYLTKIEERLILLTSFFLTLLTLVAIFNRYLLNYSMPWYEEIALILYSILIFWGASNAAKDNKHLTLTILSDKLKGGNAVIYLNLFVELFCLIVSILGIYCTMKINLTVTMRTTYFNIPNYLFFFFAITLGFSGLTLRYLYKVVTSLNKLNNKKVRRF